MPFDPTDPKYASPLAAVAQDRMTGMLNQPQMKVFASAPQDGGTTSGSPILPGQMQLNRTMGMARGGPVSDELAGIKDTIRQEFLARGLDFDKFVSNPAVMDEVGKSIASQGQNGDTILAHINPQEARVLKEMGGSGTINPHTGLPQFDNPSMGAYDAPSSSSVSPGLSGFGGGSSSPSGVSGGGMQGGPNAGGNAGGMQTGGGGGISRPVTPTPSTAGSIYGGGGGGGGGISSPQTTLSPLGTGGGSVPMGQTQSQPSETIGSVPSFASVDPMSGLPIGGASNISGLGYVATAPSLAPSLAPAAGVDTGANQPVLSNINFSDMNVGMAPDAIMPGGISNFASSPINPGYVDPGVTAMRLAASDPAGRRTEYYMGKLGSVDPRVQGQFLGMINDRMAANIPTAITPRGAHRTAADQIALAAEKAAGLNPNVVAAPGTSLHEMMTVDPMTGLPVPGSLALDVGGRNLTPAQTAMAEKIAESYGLYGNQIVDPGHFQAVPFEKGAMQMAQAKYPALGGQEPSMLQSALNTASNIASELFGVKSAQADAIGPQGTMVSNPEIDMFNEMQRERFVDQHGPFMSSSGIVAAPEQQGSFGPSPEIIDIPLREINRQFVSPEYVSNITPEAQVAGSGVFPSYEQTGIKYPERAPSAGVLAPIAQPVQIAPPPTPIDRFGLPQNIAGYGSEAPDYAIREGALGAFGPYGISSEYVAPSTSAEPTEQPILQASSESLPVIGSDLAELMGTNPQGNYLFSGVDLSTKTIPNTATVNVPKAIDIYNPWLASPEQVYKGLIEKLTGTPEKPIGTWTPGTTLDPETGLPTTGVATWPTPDFAKMTDEQIKEYNDSLKKYGPAMQLTPQKEITSSQTNWGQPAAGPYQSVSYGAGPMSFADLTPLSAIQQAAAVSPQTTGLSSFETALGALPVTTKTPEYATPRIAPLTEPISTEQAKQTIGYYDKPLEAGETIRENFNEAFADAAEKGLKEFSWKNPATGVVGRYKVAYADGGLVNVPAAASPLNNVAPQIALPTINLQKFATPYTGVSPDYKPPTPAPAPTPTPEPTMSPLDWLKTKFTSKKDAPRSMSDWQNWFTSNMSTIPQNVQDWYKALPTEKKNFQNAFKPLWEKAQEDKNKSDYVAPVFTPRVRTPMPQEYGGYGGEYSYFAQGGVVSPLSAARKR